MTSVTGQCISPSGYTDTNSTDMINWASSLCCCQLHTYPSPKPSTLLRKKTFLRENYYSLQSSVCKKHMPQKDDISRQRRSILWSRVCMVALDHKEWPSQTKENYSWVKQVWEPLFAEEDLSRQRSILHGFMKLNSPCKNLHLIWQDLTYFMQMSHFSLPGTRTSRSHHEADSTADGEKKKVI